MTGYKRQISYLDRMENGVKTGNAGFVKAEEHEGRIRIEVRVKNLPDTVSGEFALLEEGGRELGRISLSKGAGSCCLVWDGQTEERPQDRETGRVKSGGLFMELPGGRRLKAAWKEPVWVPLPKEKEDRVEYPELKWQDAETLFEPEMRINSAEEDGRQEEDKERADKETADKETAEEETESEALQPPCFPAQASDCGCRGDKWEQLCTMYPVIHPFGDDREYLSVAPGDFVILRQEYQKMVHNSFLLHGYYNYRHLILGRMKEGKEWRYYLGVPGNFYHREKMVAEMFGFEAFEGEKDSAAPGDFGYFMKQVEI